MNKNIRHAWRGAFVPQLKRSVVATACGLLCASAWSACTPGLAGNVADAGSTCTVDASTNYLVFLNDTGAAIPSGVWATGAGSHWTVLGDLEVHQQDGALTRGFAAVNGGTVTLQGSNYVFSFEVQQPMLSYPPGATSGVAAAGGGSLVEAGPGANFTISVPGDLNNLVYSANNPSVGVDASDSGQIRLGGHVDVVVASSSEAGSDAGVGVRALTGGQVALGSLAMTLRPGFQATGVSAVGAGSSVEVAGPMQITADPITTVTQFGVRAIVATDGGRVAAGKTDIAVSSAWPYANALASAVEASRGSEIDIAGGSISGHFAARVPTDPLPPAVIVNAGTFRSTAPLAIEGFGGGILLRDQAAGASLLELDETRISTAGSFGALFASGITSLGGVPADRTIRLHGPLTVEASGDGALGIYVLSGLSETLRLPTGSSIATTGANAPGIGFAAGQSVAYPVLDIAAGTSIRTTGPSAAVSLQFQGEAVAAALAGSLETQGDAAPGLLVSSRDGNITTGGRIATRGAGSDGIQSHTEDGAFATTSSFTLNNSAAIEAGQANGIALSHAGANGALTLVNTGAVTGAKAAVDMRTLTFDALNAVYLPGGSATVVGSITNSGSLAGGEAGVRSGMAGSLALRNSGSISGPIALLANAGVLNAENTESGRITGTLQAAGGMLHLVNAGLWSNTGNSLLGNLGNAGTIANTAPDGGVFKTITVDNYAGQGGLLGLHTFLGGDDSPSDRLVILGGSATGTTRMRITNAGGSGAQTTGNGILVVDARQGATTSAGAFSLAGPASAGAYDYALVRRPDESWYLTSDLAAAPVKPPATALLPNYRQETALYAAVPSLAVLYSLATTLDSFHERIGGAGPVAGLEGQPSRLWVRMLGNTGERKGDGLGVYGNEGPVFDYKTFALQLGGNLYRGGNADGSRTTAGAFMTTGQTTGDVTHLDSPAGQARLDVNSLGMYVSLLGAGGAYVDFVAQANHYGVTSTSTRMPSVKTSGSGADVSVEGGMPFRLSDAWRIEPQLQLRSLSADLGSGADIAGLVRYGDVESLVGRAGLKLAYQESALSAWTRLDLLNEFEGRSETTVSSLQGENGVDFASNLHGRSVALSAGLDAKLAPSVSFYGSASYRRTLDGGREHAWGAQAGVKVAW